jgi:hypothetical protein
MNLDGGVEHGCKKTHFLNSWIRVPYIIFNGFLFDVFPTYNQSLAAKRIVE